MKQIKRTFIVRNGKEGKIFGNLEKQVHEACTQKSLAIGDNSVPTIFTRKPEIPVIENQTVRAIGVKKASENTECDLRRISFFRYTS